MTIKLKSLLKENNILVPKNLDSRIEQRKRIDFQRIQEYIKNGSQGTLDLDGTPLTKLPDNLTKVGGNLFIGDSNIEDLNNLEYVGANLWITETYINELPEGLRIGGNLSCKNSPLFKRFSDESSFREYLKERNVRVEGIIFGNGCLM